MHIDTSAQGVEVTVTVRKGRHFFGYILEEDKWYIRLEGAPHKPILLNRKYEIGRKLPVLVEITGDEYATFDIAVRDLMKIYQHNSDRRRLEDAIKIQEQVQQKEIDIPY